MRYQDFVREYAASIDRMMTPGKSFTSLDLPDGFMEAWGVLEDFKKAFGVESFSELTRSHTKGASTATFLHLEALKGEKTVLCDARVLDFVDTMPVSGVRTKRNVG